MTDAYAPPPVPRLRYGAIGSGFLSRLQLRFLACMNDIPYGADDFLHWAVPGEHAVLDVVESAGLPEELLARSCAKLRRRSRACCSKQRAGES